MTNGSPPLPASGSFLSGPGAHTHPLAHLTCIIIHDSEFGADMLATLIPETLGV